MQFELSVDYAKYLVTEYAVPFGINLVIALLVFYIGRAVAKGLVRLLGKAFARADLDESLSKFVQDLAYAVLLMVVIIAALDRLGVKTTAAVAVLGAAGLAIGLALQGSLGNFASGVLIVFFKPYKVGDYVNVAGKGGTVEAVKIFNTILNTPDNVEVIIPNGQITAGVIENFSAKENRRIDLVIGVGYDDDLKKAKETIENVLKAEKRLLAEPAWTVAVSELADSSVNFVVRPWVKGSEYWPTRFALIENIKNSLDEAGISIPYPQRDVHMHQAA
jgi:small conductance mechanosensitive channel